MRSLARRITCGAALVAAIAPAHAAGRAGAQPRGRIAPVSGPTSGAPVHALPAAAGTGSGTWRLPSQGTGVANVSLFDESGRLCYLVRANLVRSGEMPPLGMPEQGGFHGSLILIERDGSRVPVAQVLGKWIREADGSGSFGVEIFVPSEHFDEPLVSIGAIEGLLGAAPAKGHATGAPGIRAQRTSALGRLTSTWVLAP